jgi:Fic family protein
VNSFRSGRIARPVNPRLLRTLAAIHRYQGKQELYAAQVPETLSILQQRAVIESTESSSRIEGVIASPARIREVLLENAEPTTRSEAELAGYKATLDMIHRHHSDIAVTPNVVRQLHGYLFQFVPGRPGRWKPADNNVTATLPNGKRIVVFRAVPAVATPQAMKDLCDDTYYALLEQQSDRLLITGAFILDFLCIHPFHDGNGRVARLLTTLLLYRTHFDVARYISIERLIEGTKENYYVSLRASSERWHQGKHDLDPWWEYFLGILLAAYRELDDRLRASAAHGPAARVRNAINGLPEFFTVGDVEHMVPGVSRPTMNRVLREMRIAKEIKKVNAGRYAQWQKLDRFYTPR